MLADVVSFTGLIGTVPGTQTIYSSFGVSAGELFDIAIHCLYFAWGKLSAAG